MVTLNDYLNQLFPDRTIQNYVLWILSKAYYEPSQYQRPFVIFRGPGANGKSLFTHFLLGAFPKQTLLSKKATAREVGSNKVGSNKVICMVKLSRISCWWRYDDVLNKCMPICISNIYPDLKDGFAFYANITVIPFESTFVEPDRVDPERHQYLSSGTMTSEQKAVFAKDFYRWQTEFPDFLQKFYETYKESPPSEPSSITEERDAMRIFNNR